MQNETLYKALLDFPLAETGGAYTFLDRLCRENAWSRPFALEAIAEYKRFLYLSQLSSSPVTPPYAVDQVWHLHLLYTRSYWYDLCQPILGRPLHHGPTRGGREEDEKFGELYAQTRELYETEFCLAPPPNIWPLHFTPEKPVRWVDTARNWVIPKPIVTGILPCVFPLLLLGAKALPALFFLALAVLFLVLMIYLFTDNNPRSKSDGGGCSTFSGCSSSSGGDCGGGDGGGGCCGGGCSGGCGGGD